MCWCNVQQQHKWPRGSRQAQHLQQMVSGEAEASDWFAELEQRLQPSGQQLTLEQVLLALFGSGDAASDAGQVVRWSFGGFSQAEGRVAASRLRLSRDTSPTAATWRVEARRSLFAASLERAGIG